jgi:hypothetical protein
VLADIAYDRGAKDLSGFNMIDSNEVLRRINDKETVAADEVTHMLNGQDSNTRQLALLALVRTHVREAMFRAVDLAQAQGYGSQGTIDVIQRLLTVGDTELPLVEVLKGIGLRAAASAQFDQAMQYLQEAVNKAFQIGQNRDRLSKTAMRFLHDRQIDEALESLARLFRPIAHSKSSARNRITILVSALIDENAPSLVCLRYGEGLRRLGFDVDFVSTGYVPSGNSRVLGKLREAGFSFVETTGAKPSERVGALLNHFEQHPVDAVCYFTTSMDHFAKVLSCVGAAPAQVFLNFAYEPHVGKFQYIAQGVSKDQETKTLWPGRSRFVRTFVAMGPEIDASAPMDLRTLGIPDGKVVLGTFGRVEKCVSPEYLDAMTAILKMNPDAFLLIAGPGSPQDIAYVQNAFVQAGVGQQMLYGGQRQADTGALLKAIDVYCDTHPWPGGQSIQEAMYVGVPIVAMRRKVDRLLDPTGTGTTTSTAEAFLSDVADMANAGDTQGYARIATRFIRHEGERAQAARIMRKRADDICSYDEAMKAMAQLVRDAIAQAAV